MAAPLCPTGAISFADFSSTFGSCGCSVGGTTFAGFTVDGSSTTGTFVDIDHTGDASGGTYTLTFTSPEWTVTGNGLTTRDVGISYSIDETTAGFHQYGAVISGSSTAPLAVSSNWFVDVEQAGYMTLTADKNTPNPAQLEYPVAPGLLSVHNTLSFGHLTTVSRTTYVTSFSNTFVTQIPEPATLALFGAGLALMSFSRLRRHRS